MVSVPSINNVALLILQQAAGTGSTQRSEAGNDVLKAVTGISGEPSRGILSGASVAGRFALDSAPASGRVVIGDLGSFDSWEEAFAHVENNEHFSRQEKDGWLETLKKARESVEAAERFRRSELYQSLTSGALREEFEALHAAAKDRGLTEEAIDAVNALAAEHGRGMPFSDRTKTQLLG